MSCLKLEMLVLMLVFTRLAWESVTTAEREALTINMEMRSDVIIHNTTVKTL